MAFQKILCPLMAAALLTLTACGGGGASPTSATATNTTVSSSSSLSSNAVDPTPPPAPTASPVSYSPDEALLDAGAADSTKLYIEESFNFDQHINLHLDVQAISAEGVPMANKRVKITSINAAISSWDDSRLSERALLAIGSTDANGYFVNTLQIPASVQKILLEVNVIGIQNKVILAIGLGQEMSISHIFH
ncbi:hypothetical protein [Teredinibacter haidensis]|uniref:hypothetical protein n=1 Tax=Teredinibacter haidensis TaxID=2731755 RepID=UPI000A8D4F1B|nr:hypothetical protein [Teredinibacter haidensis]